MYDTTIIPVGAPGTGKKSWNIPNSRQVASVIIDNASGSWLFIPQDRTYIPPYRMGFMHSFTPTYARIDILFSNGPAGQISTQQGDPVRATIYDTLIGDSPGTDSQGGAFIEQFTPTLFASGGGTADSSVGLLVTLIAAVANKRIRVLTIDTIAGQLLTTGSFGVDSSVSYQHTDTVGNFAGGRLSPMLHPTDHFIYANGLDLGIGNPLRVTVLAEWASQFFKSFVSYQLI